MKKYLSSLSKGCLMLLFVGALSTMQAWGKVNYVSSYALIARVIPRAALHFKVENISSLSGKDVFEIEGVKKKIVLRGNNGVSIASALYYYLTTYCHCQITWNGINLHLPAKLPLPSVKIRKNTPYPYRYYLNYCTFNYSMSWWGWKRWEREIDWMAMHGINMPLALTGQEYTWYQVYKSLGFTDTELQSFFCGPAYFSWFWMGNLDGWEGALPLNWMKSHRDLQIKILQRERELGMKPVLQSFTGHIPSSFSSHFPTSRLKKTNWNNGFGDTFILNTQDPMFAELGHKFLEVQTKLYGTDHLYSADTFNENEPPTDDPAYLSSLSLRVYEAMSKSDPKAIWVMQGWLFFSDRKFWKTPQIKALLAPVPDNKMIILDLATEIEPVWKRTEAYYGKPWIWNMLHNFGGNIGMFGHLEEVAKNPALALKDTTSRKMAGIGLTMEGIEQNPVLYELMTSNTWQREPINLDKWLRSYILNRYGTLNAHLIKSWQILKETVYNGKYIRDAAESILTGRPTFDSATTWTHTRLNYPRKDLLPAWDELMKAIPLCSKSDGFQYDLVDLSRQVLANYAGLLQKKWVIAYQNKNLKDFNKYSDQYLQLISDMDTLLATRKDFLLGPWLADARLWGATIGEKAIYERNARNLITLWGDQKSPLHEYSCRQWSGLLNDFYRVRWQKFFSMASGTLKNRTTLDLKAFNQNISEWEWEWVNKQKPFPITTGGNSITIAQKLFKKYRLEIIEDL